MGDFHKSLSVTWNTKCAKMLYLVVIEGFENSICEIREALVVDTEVFLGCALQYLSELYHGKAKSFGNIIKCFPQRKHAASWDCT